MKVTVSVHGRYHGFELAKGLSGRGHLGQLLTTYPTFFARKIVGGEASIESAPLLELRRRLHSRFPVGAKPDLHIAEAFAKFASRHCETGTDIFVGWSSASLEAIEPARQSGAKVIIERGSTHIQSQTDVLRAAYQQFGLEFSETEPQMIAREIEEYELADTISVPSTYAAQSFIERGVSADKLLVNGLGVDLDRFQPPENRPPERKPRIIFAGGVGIRKGVPWLLRAFKRISSKAELHILGPASNDFRDIMRGEPMENVHMRGAVPGDALSSEYGKADIFCLPSLEEGYGMVIPQAMACGLPIVTTDVVGAADLLSDGIEGLLVAPGDSEALGDALERLVDDARLRRLMGTAALKTIQSGHSWDDYLERTVASYEKLLKRS